MTSSLKFALPTIPARNVGSALSGTDRLLLFSSSENGKRKSDHPNVINAANGAGVCLIALQHGVLMGAVGNWRISSASRVDYSKAAATFLAGGDHADRTYELAGDRPSA